MRNLLFLCSFFLLWVSPAIVSADSSIQEKIDHASSGDTISLDDQVYQETITIDKPITLQGADGTVIEGTGEGNVLTITADNVTIEDITVRNGGSSLSDDDAGIKVQSSGNTFTGNTIETSLHGIYLQKSNDNELKENTITGNTSLNPSRRGNGIHLYYSHDNNIADNTITESRDGIYFSFSEDNLVEQNEITETRYGLHYMYSDDNEFYSNEFFENVGGAAIMYSDHILLEENSFHDHHGLQSFGILLQTSNHVSLNNNRIQFNQKAVFMDQSTKSDLQDNHINHNRIGLDVWGSSKDNVFTSNTIMDNKLTYSSNNEEDKNEWSQDGVGNEWDDQTFTDLDQDGIGDKTYTTKSSFGEVMVEQPLGALFLESPALTIYEKWNNLFDKSGDGIHDPYPIKNKNMPINPILIASALLIIIVFLVLGWRKRHKQKAGDPHAHD